MRSRTQRQLLGVVLAAGIALAGCSSAAGEGSTAAPDATGESNGESLMVAMALPMTGTMGSFGSDQAIAAQMAVDKINDAGGVEGRPLELLALDTQGDPGTAIQAANRLTSVEKVPVFVSAVTPIVKAQAPIANSQEVVMISMGASAPDVAELGDFVYTGYPLADVDVTAMAQYTLGELAKQTAAVLYINNDAGQEGAAIYTEAFEAGGGTVAAEIAYQPDATSFQGQVQAVQSSGADVIFIHGLVEDIPRVIAQLRQAGVDTQITTFSTGHNPAVIDQLGDAAEGVIVADTAPTAEDNPAVQEYLDAWQSEQNRSPAGVAYTMYVHDSVYMIKDLYQWVLTNEKDINGQSIREAIQDIGTFDMPLVGEVTINDDHTVKKPVNILQVIDGKFTKIDVVS